MASPITTILWDIDGTLVDSESLHERATEWVLHSNGFCLPHNLHTATLGLGTDETHGWLQREMSLPISLESWKAQKQEYYLAHSAQLRFRDGAQGLWQALRLRGYQMGLVSSSDRILVDANIQAVFPEVIPPFSISRDDVRSPKPSSEPYLKCAQCLGAIPSQCIVIEDSPHGVQAGLSAGMKTFFIPEDVSKPAPSGATKVCDFKELGTKIFEC
jgi:HAD superfamily hydrolase (TIGR01509 family)